ncbi:MAG: SCO family protein [Phycisphaerae bacterium]
MPRSSLIILLFAFPLAAAVVFWLSFSTTSDSGTEPLPIIFHTPEFSLTERSGRTVTHNDLRGHVWLADFIFTRCAGPCPKLTLRMRSLQESLKQYDDDVKLVSFTLDPTYDTPKVLSRYAQRGQADADFWWFLTGKNETAVHTLVEKGFLQAVSRAKGGRGIVHSTYFVLVDRMGRARGLYDGLDAASKPRILRDVATLLAEPRG